MRPTVDQSAELAVLALDRYRTPLTDHESTTARTGVLDLFGVAIGGATSKVTRTLSRNLPYAQDPTDRAESSRESANRWPWSPHRGASRARVLATAGHVLDYDDVLSSVGHPSVTLLPALLSVSDARATPGDQFLRAYVAGLEAELALCALTGSRHYEVGFHSTATFGVFGAAIASTLVRGGDVRAVTVAVRLAALSASGLKSAFGTWGKSLQVGHAASEGVIASDLALAGAPLEFDTLGGPQGFLETHHGVPGGSLTGSGFGHAAVEALSFKRHASCFGTHAAIDGATEILGENKPEEIESIALHVSTKHRGMCDQTDVCTALEAKFSLQYAVAIALCADGQVTDTTLEAGVHDERVHELAARVRLVFEDDREFGTAGTQIAFRTGVERGIETDTREYPRDLGAAMEQHREIEGKIRALLTDRTPEAAALIAACAGLGTSPDLVELNDVLA